VQLQSGGTADADPGEICMLAIKDVDASSSSLARSALLIAAVLALAGSILGISAIVRGMVSGDERFVVLSGGLFGFALLATPFAYRKSAVQATAAVSTSFYTLYLCSGALISILCPGNHENLFIYLFWFFALLMLNKLVNTYAAGRLLDRVIQIAPLAIVCGLFPRVVVLFSITEVYQALIFCLSYVCFGLMLNAVTRYREAYIVERERAESLRIESEVLESISDCFISLDSKFRLVYLNDAACAEFATERRAALNKAIPGVVPGFFSPSMLARMRDASDQASAAEFEAQNILGQWYEMRCFPQRGRISVYFRNITESVLSRHQLDAANDRVREQSELLDKAQDAIFVQDMDGRILYWNQGAQRLFGWTAAEVIGKRTGDLFNSSTAAVHQAFRACVADGAWKGELIKTDKSGRTLIVESRCTLVRGDDGRPHSLLTTNTDITHRKAADERIHHLAFHDTLTGLPNRAWLRDYLEHRLAGSPQPKNYGALLLIDLDDFKTLNDTSGHDTGDLLLQQVAARLRSLVRKCDLIARFGGDEFVVLLEGLSADAETAVAEAGSIGESILSMFRQPYMLQHFEYQGTASIGAALVESDRNTVDDLLKRSDLAMYQAKAQGRDNVCIFDPAMASSADARAVLLADLKRAMQNHEFELHYQPQVDSAGRVTGCEALLRWRHPLRGMISPMQFIPLAESSGLIVELGYWVLETACAQAAAWSRHPGTEELIIAVNVSFRQFLEARFVNQVEKAIRDSGVNPHQIKMEITESFMAEKIDETIARMTVIKALGIGFSMDDFGTGYSSLSQLKRLPLDQLKIDQSFVRDVPSGAADASIVRAIITLGRSLNLRVIAEGVETEQQRAFLDSHGCNAFQGFLFAPALPLASFESYVAATAQEQETAA
jgi:diguanylate cyclase (GGDEF)-like protein/PAS domain S-box-containing protein